MCFVLYSFSEYSWKPAPRFMFLVFLPLLFFYVNGSFAWVKSVKLDLWSLAMEKLTRSVWVISQMHVKVCVCIWTCLNHFGLEIGLDTFLYFLVSSELGKTSTTSFCELFHFWSWMTRRSAWKCTTIKTPKKLILIIYLFIYYVVAPSSTNHGPGGPHPKWLII